jgi:hypothetical protein
LRGERDPVFVYFFGPPDMYYGNATIRFQAPAIAGVDVLKPIRSAGELAPAPDGERPIFVFLPNRARELAIIQARYPGGQLRRVAGSSPDASLVTIYEPE